MGDKFSIAVNRLIASTIPWCLLILAQGILLTNFVYASPSGKEDITKVVSYVVEVQNKGGTYLTGVNVYIAIPLSRTPWQLLTDVKSTPPFKERLNKGDEGEFLLVTTDLPPYGIVPISIQAKLKLFQEGEPGDKPSKEQEDYLLATRYNESSNEKIIKSALPLQRDTIAATARAVSKWINDTLSVTGYTERRYGALYALEHGGGDCTEFADLFVALLRVLKIPSRTITGMLLGDEVNIRAQNYHTWAEYFDGAKWQTTDPSRIKEDYKPGHYVAFGIQSSTDKVDVPRLFYTENSSVEIRWR